MTRTRTKAADAKTDEQLERSRLALGLRLNGVSLRKIGKQLDISYEQVRRDIEAALALTRDELAQDASHYRAMEVERLDAMLFAIHENVNRGEYAAIDRALRIMERRSKLLGLDAPVQVETVTAESKMIDAIRAREFDYATVLGIVDNDTSLAAKLFAEAGVPIER